MGIPTVVTVKGIEKEIKTTDFDITQEDSEALFQNGVRVAQKFLETWDFEEWKKQYR
jgi:NTE family protein